MRNKRLIMLVLLMAATLLVGCWDQVEIDDRIFIAILGFDIAPEDLAENPGQSKYQLSISFPNQSGGLGGEVELTNVYLSSLGSNMHSILRQIGARTSKSIYFGHLRGLVLGEELAKDPRMIREILDAFENNPLISRRISIGIVEGKAKDIIEMEPQQEGDVGQYITRIFRKMDKSQRAPLMDIGEVLISLHNNGDVLIPRLVPDEKEIKTAGSAVIKNFALVGWLGEKETIAANMAAGKVDLIVIDIPFEEMLIPYNITDGRARYEIFHNKEDIIFKIEIDVEGDLEQMYLNAEEDLTDPKFINELQSQAEKKIKDMVEGTLVKLQKEFNSDALDISSYIQKYHPSLWKEIEEDWDEVYKNMNFEVVADVKIRRVGLSR
ncbi:Ger(x)C family spore germination protein [Alkaliphilus serpentinus]|uniref:Ger(X)C family spore germination protein n=1 Tax=Alkaliphilus serpentinus TaxID=1482731 RepID=A0A833M952_9FIRM|nr:Ger(x)C family spore germination protein [Alkaliphilus serpentinus]KAB3532480.1 Ger(x)C family spore germination protein [Alkaliphilus serpentinus]